MINIINTEFSFKKCYLPINQVHKYVIDGKLAIADYDNTFGHIPFMNEANKHHFLPIYGVRLRVSRDENKARQTGHLYSTFIAKNDEGLVELYRLVQKAYDNFYYFPRLFESDIKNLHSGILNLGEGVLENNFGDPQDRDAYEIIAGGSKRGDQFLFSFENKAGPMHVIPQDINLDMCDANIQRASMVQWGRPFDLKDECMKGFINRCMHPTEEYLSMMNYEL